MDMEPGPPVACDNSAVAAAAAGSASAFPFLLDFPFARVGGSVSGSALDMASPSQGSYI